MIYQDIHGHRIEPVNPDAALVLYFRQGGGFQQSMPNEHFHAVFKVAPAPTWRRGTVTAEWFYGEADHGPVLPCWTDGDVWNGWGMPHFNRATIDDLIKRMPDIKWVGNALEFGDPDDRQLAYPVIIPGVGEPLWGLGAGSWTWDQVEAG